MKHHHPGIMRRVMSFARAIIVYIFRTPFLKKIQKSHPHIYVGLAKRFSIHRFSGMPLTLLLLAILSNLLMLLDQYEDILNSKTFASIDNTLASFLYENRINGIAKFFYYFTQLGNEYVIFAAVLLMSGFLFYRHERYAIPGLLISVAGSALTVLIGKSIWKVHRPLQFAYYQMDSFSFPSGHSTAAVAFYGILFYLLIRETRKLRTKFILFISWLALSALIGFSRIYLCEHYLSDVVGGYMLGSIWLLASISYIAWKEDIIKRRK